MKIELNLRIVKKKFIQIFNFFKKKHLVSIFKIVNFFLSLFKLRKNFDFKKITECFVQFFFEIVFVKFWLKHF